MTKNRHQNLPRWLAYSRPAIVVFSALLLMVGLWNLYTQIRLWSETVILVSGTIGAVKEESIGGGVRYTVDLTVDDTGEEIEFRLRNSGPVQDWFVRAGSGTKVGILYGKGSGEIISLHPEEPPGEMVREQGTPYFVRLVGAITSISLALLLYFAPKWSR
ncbi:MAG: hypothetical protein ABFQ89_02590 [Chloroflexota bacterium]